MNTLPAMRGSATSGAPTQRRIVSLVLLPAMALAACGQTVVIAAAPSIVAELGGFDSLCWVVASYLIGVAVATPISGRLGERRGHHLVLLGGMTVFVLGSGLCAVTQSMTGLILLRGIQGVGAGAAMVSAQSTIAGHDGTASRVSRASSLGVAFAAATAAGPAIGGVLTELLDWRSLFYLQVPLGILTMFLVVITYEPGGDTAARARPVDYAGPVLLGASIVTLVLLLSLAGISYAWDSAVIIALAGAALLARGALYAAERRAKLPALPLGLFRDRQFLAGVAFGFMLGAVLFGSLTFLPLLRWGDVETDPVIPGLQASGLLFALLGASLLAGRYIHRGGRHRRAALAGVAVATLALLSLSQLADGAGAGEELGLMLMLGAGLGLAVRVPLLAVQNTVTYELLGAATTSTIVFRTVGAAFGTGMFAFVFGNTVSSTANNGFASSNEPIRFGTHPAVDAGSVTDSLSIAFLVAAGLLVATLVLLMTLRGGRLRTGLAAPSAGDAFPPPRDLTSFDEMTRLLPPLAGDAGGEGAAAAEWDSAVPPLETATTS